MHAFSELGLALTLFTLLLLDLGGKHSFAVMMPGEVSK